MKVFAASTLLALALPALIHAQPSGTDLRSGVVEFPSTTLEATLLFVNPDKASLRLLVSPAGTNECLVWIDQQSAPKYVRYPDRDIEVEHWRWEPLAQDAHLVVDLGTTGVVDLAGRTRIHLAPNDRSSRCHYQVLP